MIRPGFTLLVLFVAVFCYFLGGVRERIWCQDLSNTLAGIAWQLTHCPLKQ
jgi:hypothetical protein